MTFKYNVFLTLAYFKLCIIAWHNVTLFFISGNFILCTGLDWDPGKKTDTMLNTIQGLRKQACYNILTPVLLFQLLFCVWKMILFRADVTYFMEKKHNSFLWWKWCSCFFPASAFPFAKIVSRLSYYNH